VGVGADPAPQVLCCECGMRRLNGTPTQGWLERLAVLTFLTVVGLLTLLGLIIAIT
jgi:hypothetical protein